MTYSNPTLWRRLVAKQRPVSRPEPRPIVRGPGLDPEGQKLAVRERGAVR